MTRLDTKLYAEMASAFGEALELWSRKQRDYGPNNIAMMGETGLVTRLNDKVQRLTTLLNSAGLPNHESLRDSWLDAINYAAMGLLVRDGKWPMPAQDMLSSSPAKCRHCNKEL